MSTTVRSLAEGRIRRVAGALNESVRGKLVFIGGSVLPLLVDVDARLEAPRVTSDVDAVTATATYTQMHTIELALSAARFKHDVQGHAGRWHTPDGEIFDLTYAGEHTGGTGAAVDTMAIQTAITLPGDPSIRHVNGVGLFLMKTAAFGDRGVDQAHDSKDLADLAVLLIGRPMLHSEMADAAPDIQQAVRDAAGRLRATDNLAGALKTHFRARKPIPPDTPDDLAAEAVGVLARLWCAS